MISAFLQNARAWAIGKEWKWRALLLAWFLYIFIHYFTDSSYSSILDPLNLGIHELGHFVFSLFGYTISIAGGTLLQIIVPIPGMLNFYRQEDFFSLALCWGWLSTSLFGIARYCADARVLELPLVSPFGAGCVHDWNYLLDRIDLLSQDTFIDCGCRTFYRE